MVDLHVPFFLDNYTQIKIHCPHIQAHFCEPKLLGGWNLIPQGTAFGICAQEQPTRCLRSQAHRSAQSMRGSSLFVLWNLSSKMNCKTIFHYWRKGLSTYRSSHIQIYFIQKYYTTYKLFILTAEILIQQVCFLQTRSLWAHWCICCSVLSWSTLKNPQRVFHWSCFSLICCL